MRKRFILVLALVFALAAFYLFLKASPTSTNVIWNISRGGTWLLPLVVTSAALDSLNPCAFSILLLTIGLLFGAGRLRKDIAKIGASYILGIFFAYLAIGIGILQALHLFSTPHLMAKLGAWLMIAIGGINIVQVLFPQFPIRLQIPHVSHRTMAVFINKGSFPAMFLLGGLVGLCEFPCTGGPYLAVLGLLRAKETMLSGFSYLLLYNFVFVLPLIVILFLATQKEIAERMSNWQKQSAKSMRLVVGSAMILLGFIILKFFV